MKLNANILYFDLALKHHVECFCMNGSALVQGRPEFIIEESNRLQKGHLYITTCDKAVRLTDGAEDTVIICVGSSFVKQNYLHYDCIWVKDAVPLQAVFNEIQQLCDRYDSWERALLQIEGSSASTHEMLQYSMPIFPTVSVLTLTDNELNYLAQISNDDYMRRSDAFRADFSNVIGHMRTDNTSQYHNKPFFTTQGSINLLNIDVFDNDTFLANLSLAYFNGEPTARDVALVEFLAQHLKAALMKKSPSVKTRIRSLQTLFQKLLDGIPIKESHLQTLLQTGTGCEYQCVKMKPSGNYRRISGAYICTMIENTFKGSVAFQYDDAIVSFIDCTSKAGNDETQEAQLKEFIQMLSQVAGVSNRFKNLALAPLYYRQAGIALDHGDVLNGKSNFFFFSDYVLSYMLSNAMGDFPLQLFLPDGIKKLMEHDAVSDTNYIQTLRTYLNNNMSIVKTAEDLFVHRSTLLPRIKRINTLLQMDLQDPDQRLLVQMLLKIMEEESTPLA